MKIKMIGNVYLWICLNLLLLLVPHLGWGQQTCHFTSPDSTTFVIGQENSFQVTVDPPGEIRYRGELPLRVRFDGETGILSGTPVEGSSSFYILKFQAYNESCFTCKGKCYKREDACIEKCKGDVECEIPCYRELQPCFDECNCSDICEQPFTLHIIQPPCGFTSSNTTTFALEQENTFEITVADSYSGSITLEGGLPAGVFFHDNEDGTATLSGTPASDTTGCYPLTLHFSGSIPDQPDSTCESSQSFLLIVGDGCSPARPIDFIVRQKEVLPENQLARAKRNKIQFDNILRWRAPRRRAGIVAYRIYLDRDLQHLALEIPSRDRKRFRAVQRNVNPCKIQKYFLVSVNEFDIESKPVKAKVKMAKHNCSLKKEEHEHSSSSFSSSSCRE